MLPLHCDIQTFIEYAVAPYVGAWIETQRRSRATLYDTVAPYVGAWIETRLDDYGFSIRMSHPTWVRGLKRLQQKTKNVDKPVAPYVGAWIETIRNG